ncbi:MAG: NAD(P)H-dependent oxidoreductase subunit E, partial [Gammaproteobacteria bacterium]|nr:NAD(P)H-dependent oxidoreductase subunit E [Gammaproteobacteria bacterium]
TFYHHFRRSRPGRTTVSLCQAEACQSMGAAALAAHARRRLGVDFHETTADGRYTLEPIYCLGNCACSPAAMIDGRLYGRLTPERLDALLATPEGTS